MRRDQGAVWGEALSTQDTTTVSFCSCWMVGTAPSTLALSGLRSRIQPAGPVGAKPNRVGGSSGLCSVGSWEGLHMGPSARGVQGGDGDVWGRNVGIISIPLVSVNTSAVYQRPGNWEVGGKQD